MDKGDERRRPDQSLRIRFDPIRNLSLRGASSARSRRRSASPELEELGSAHSAKGIYKS
jgi:hypothetical protein